jgi:hypothetical protein
MQDTETADIGGDDLRSTIANAMKEFEPASTEVDAPAKIEPAIAEVAEKPARVRDESGKFAKQEEAQESVIAQPEKAKEEKLPPPMEWSGHAKVEWDRLPKHVQEELRKGSEKVSKYDALEQVISPRRQALSATYGSEAAAIDQLFKISDFAEKNPAEFIQWFAQQRGINLGAYAPQGTPKPNEVDGQQPEAAILREVADLRQQIASITQGQQQQYTQTLQQQIESFQTQKNPDGSLKHPYFNDVRVEMGALMQSGRVKTLDEAYDAAVWARPDIRSNLMERQEAQRRAEQQAKVNAAKSASATVSGAPGLGGGASEAPASTVREELVRSFRAHGQRV